MASNNNYPEIDVIATQYADLVKKEMKVESIYLFGSYTNGTPNQDSDIDIAVIADDFSGDVLEDTLWLMKIRRKVDLRIEPHAMKADNPFIKEVIATGRKIG